MNKGQLGRFMRMAREWSPYPEMRPDVGVPHQGWSHEESGSLLLAECNSNTRVIVEVGSFLGFSAMEMAKKAVNATIICLDTWLGGTMSFRCASVHLDMHRRMWDIFCANTWEMRHRIVPLRNDSVSGLLELKEYGIEPDLMYIDGGHEYLTCRNDISLAVESFPTAVIICDDYDYVGVTQAANETAETSRRVFTPGRGACRFGQQPPGIPTTVF